MRHTLDIERNKVKVLMRNRPTLWFSGFSTDEPYQTIFLRQLLKSSENDRRLLQDKLDRAQRSVKGL